MCNDVFKTPVVRMGAVHILKTGNQTRDRPDQVCADEPGSYAHSLEGKDWTMVPGVPHSQSARS